MEGGMDSGMDHTGHDHSAHAGGEHDKYHGSVQRLPDGTYFYTHGAFLGHIVPGCFFIVWGTWWLIAGFEYYLRSLSSREPFRARSWYRWAWAPRALNRLPLEPMVKVALPLLGILGELWLGHESFRRLIASNGMFEVDNLNDWQHSSMYLAFATSGVVDILGHYSRLPNGTEHGFLSLAFITQLLLLLFHLKGPGIEVMVHLILGLQVASTVLAIFGEMAVPNSIVMASVRPFLTVLQGVWWIQTAYIMYRGNPAWDPEYMGSTMMAPVVLAVHMLWIAFASLSVLLLMRFLHERAAGRPLHLSSPSKAYHQHVPLPEDSAGDPDMDPLPLDIDVEMSSLITPMPHKHVR